MENKTIPIDLNEQTTKKTYGEKGITIKKFPANLDVDFPKGFNTKILHKMGTMYESLTKLERQLFMTYIQSLEGLKQGVDNDKSEI